MATIPLVGVGLKEVEDTGDLPDVLSILSAAAGGDAKVIIYRHSVTAKLEYVETVQLAAISSQGLDYIQRKHGGGDYRLQVHGKRADGKSGIVKAFDVSISAIPVQVTTPMQQFQPQYAPIAPAWDSDKIIAVLGAAAPLVRAGAEWWSARQQPTLHPYPYHTQPAQVGSGLTALSETVMSLRMMNDIKETMKDVFGNVASDNGGNQRNAMLQALAPALGAMMGGGQPPPPPPTQIQQNPIEEVEEVEDMNEPNEPNEYETVLELIANSIRHGLVENVVELLRECQPDARAKILHAPNLHVTMFASKYGLRVSDVKQVIALAKKELENESDPA